MNKEFMKQI